MIRPRFMIVSFASFITIEEIIMSKNDSEHVEAPFWAELLIDNQVHTCTMIYLSMNSMELEMRSPPPIGSDCSVRVQLHNRHNTDLSVLCQGSIVEHTDEGVRFRIRSADNEEGLNNLRNIVLFHAIDPKRAAADLDRADED